jgi:hypothetical protein
VPDAEIKDVHLYLRYLLSETGIATKSWFWHAEAKVYAGSMQWMPLLGTRRRGSRKQTPWFDIAVHDSPPEDGKAYPEYYNATLLDEVLSIAHDLTEQFQERDPVLMPVLGLFDECQGLLDECLGDRCPGFKAVLKRAVKAKSETPFFRYLPEVRLPPTDGSEPNPGPGKRDRAAEKQIIANTQAKYCAYLRKVRDQVKAGEGWSDSKPFLIYPTEAIAVGLPLFVVENGLPRLLASMILLAKSVKVVSQRDSEAHRALLAEIAREAASLQTRGSQELQQRFHGLVTGLIPGRDVIKELADPALVRSRFRNVLMMNSAEKGHDSLAEHRIGATEREILGIDDPKQREKARDGQLLSIVFSRNLSAFRRLFSNLPNSDGDNRVLAGFWEPANPKSKDTLATTEESWNEIVSSVHAWLKALYCHQGWPENRVSDKSILETTGVYWLSSLIASALGFPSVPAHQTAFAQRLADTHPCHFWPCAKEGGPLQAAFKLPLEPGSRFLIPWLEAVSHLQRTTGKGSQCRAWIISAIKNPNLSRTSYPFPYTDWGPLRDVVSSIGKARCAVVCAVKLPAKNDSDEMSDHEDWSETANQFSTTLHDGGILAPLRRAQKADLASTLEACGLAFDGYSGIWRPLASSHNRFDFKFFPSSCKEYVVMSAEWDFYNT